jgi:ribose transport system permease protein
MMDRGRITSSAPVKLLRRVGILPPLLIGLIIYFNFQNPIFLSALNVLNVIRQTTYLAILAMGEMLPLIVGGFDLSIGAMIAFASILSTTIMKGSLVADPTTMVIIGCVVAILLSMGVGILNGLIIASFKVSPFIVTIATMTIVGGITFIVSKGTNVFRLPDVFHVVLGSGTVGGFPIPILFMIGIAIGMYVLMNRSYVGRFFYAIGANVNSAILAGVNTKKYIILAYAISAFFAGISGVLLTARVGSGEMTLGAPLMLKAIAAAVLGGAAIGGGRGNVPGVLLGAFFITMLSNGMNLMHLGSFEQMIAVGFLLVIAVATDQYLLRPH